jgi:hypothetical protein
VELPNDPEREAVLEPDLDEVAVRGLRADESVPEPLRMRLAVSGPVHRRIRAEDVAHDPDLSSYVEQEGISYEFHAIRLCCSFRPADGEPFTGCWVGIDLKSSNEDLTARPIAWSMAPQRLDRITDTSTNFSFTASLKLSVVNIGGSVTRARSTTSSTALLQAYGELSSEPSWEFTSIAGAELNGMQQLKLVVRKPVGTPVQGRTSIEANVMRPRFGVIKHHVRLLGDPPGCDFALG